MLNKIIISTQQLLNIVTKYKFLLFLTCGFPAAKDAPRRKIGNKKIEKPGEKLDFFFKNIIIRIYNLTLARAPCVVLFGRDLRPTTYVRVLAHFIITDIHRDYFAALLTGQQQQFVEKIDNFFLKKKNK
jgi:hypothetical protein